jgi:hypothetical protein
LLRILRTPLGTRPLNRRHDPSRLLSAPSWHTCTSRPVVDLATDRHTTSRPILGSLGRLPSSLFPLLVFIACPLPATLSPSGAVIHLAAQFAPRQSSRQLRRYDQEKAGPISKGRPHRNAVSPASNARGAALGPHHIPRTRWLATAAAFRGCVYLKHRKPDTHVPYQPSQLARALSTSVAACYPGAPPGVG